MADYRAKISGAVGYLKRLGYTYNSIAQEIIEKCDRWYDNNEQEFHQRKNLNGQEVEITALNFAKIGCEDDANLCEIVEINAGENETKFEGVQEILKANRFDTMYRKQLEKLSASGTVGCYIRLEGADLLEDDSIRGGEIRINYVNAEGIVPLTVVNDEIIECAFVGADLVHGKNQQTLVIFRLDEEQRYVAETYIFIGEKEQPEIHTVIQLGDVKPFAIMRTAKVNNLDDMEGYGLPKIYNAIPALKIVDLSWYILHGDLSKGDKLLFINELLAEIKHKADGTPDLTPQQKEMFILLGEKLPDQDSLIKEYNPEIRAGVIKETMEIALSFLSMSFGYGTKKYTFENGQIKTATEYIGERQDAMQDLNKQRFESTQYITDIVNAIIWFHNSFQASEGGEWSIEDELCVEYDDSYIVDKQTQLDSMRADALSFPEVPEFTIQYIMLRMNCERDEALKYYKQQNIDPEEEAED